MSELTEAAVRKEIDQLCFKHKFSTPHVLDMMEKTDVYECRTLMLDIITDNESRAARNLGLMSPAAAFRQKMRERIRIYNKKQKQGFDCKRWNKHIENILRLHESGWVPDGEHLVDGLKDAKKYDGCTDEDYAIGLKFLREMEVSP